MQLLIFLLLFSFFLLKMENGKFLNTIEWMNGFSVFRIRNYVTFQNGDWLPAVKPWLLLFDILLSISIHYRICISRWIRKPVLALCMICLFKEWIVIFCSKNIEFWYSILSFSDFLKVLFWSLWPLAVVAQAMEEQVLWSVKFWKSFSLGCICFVWSVGIFRGLVEKTRREF